MARAYLKRMSAWLDVDFREYLYVFYSVEWSLNIKDSGHCISWINVCLQIKKKEEILSKHEWEAL